MDATKVQAEGSAKGGYLKFWRNPDSSSSSDSDASDDSNFLFPVENKLQSFAEDKGLLLIAAAKGSTFLINYLLQLGVDPNVMDEDGLKPVQLAAARGKMELVEMLLPKTSRVPSVQDWSVDGILQEMQSKCGINKVKPKTIQKADVENVSADIQVRQNLKSNESDPSFDADSSSSARSNIDPEMDNIFKGMPKVERNERDFKSDIGKMSLKVKPKKNQKAEVENVSADIQVRQHSRFSKDFEETQKISGGGFGQVYRCMHKLDKKIYAIKKVAFSISEPGKTYSEVIAHSNMQCMHIVQYHQAWVEEGCFLGCNTLEEGETADHTLFIHMELCGRTLGKIIDNNEILSPKFEGRKHLFAKQILHGLKYIHEQGFIHGDMSRDNVIFDEKEANIKVADFGLARKVFEGVTVVSEGEWGNCMYEPTVGEVATNQKTFKTDIFSTGLVLLDLWYRYAYAERCEIYGSFRRGETPAYEIHPFFRRLLASNPADRPTIQEAIDEFDIIVWE